MLTSPAIPIVLVVLVVILAGSLGLLYLQTLKLKTDQKKATEDILVTWLKDMKGSVDKNAEVLERQLAEHRKSLVDQLSDQRKSMVEQLTEQRDSMDKRTKMLWERLDQASGVIQHVQKQLGGIEEFGKDMKDLSNILKSPKLRGGLGEQFLYDILADSIPAELFKTQYKFKDGSIADAVIFTQVGIIPIDSKFPMENFKLMLTAQSPDEREKAKKVYIKDVKKRIDEIASKYIKPDEGTVHQAVMYVPSENVYYEIINTQELEDYAHARNIVLTSPNSLSYMLKIILVAFRQFEVQKHAQEILNALSGLRLEGEKFNDDLAVLEGHLTRAVKSMDTVKGNYQRFYGKFDRLALLEHSEVTPSLEAPSSE